MSTSFLAKKRIEPKRNENWTENWSILFNKRNAKAEKNEWVSLKNPASKNWKRRAIIHLSFGLLGHKQHILRSLFAKRFNGLEMSTKFSIYEVFVLEGEIEGMVKWIKMDSKGSIIGQTRNIGKNQTKMTENGK